MQVKFTKQICISMSEEDAKVLLKLIERDIDKYTDETGEELGLPKNSNLNFALPLYRELERVLNG